ncbi:MAG: acyl-CoA synthetase [Acidobacteriota bacterium]
MLPLFEKAGGHGDRIALLDEAGEHRFPELLAAARRVASGLLEGRGDLEEARIAFIAPPGFDYVAILWGAWMAGGVAVPLCTSHPAPELEYVLRDAQAEAVVVHPSFQEKIRKVAGRLPLRNLHSGDLLNAEPAFLPSIGLERRALILYTSGSTSRPKGAVSTHRNLEAQICCLAEAWAWTQQDRTLHVLPLHHTHGIVNALLCPLWAGAVCEFQPGFDAGQVWERLAAGGITVFMAVPTIYSRLIADWESASADEQAKRSQACRKLRLMVSGSAALPVSAFEKWKQISGHSLLERYGMTEIGMALSNPLDGERRPGFVGQSLPGVEVRLSDEDGGLVQGEGRQGEIWVRGDNVFLEYWQRPQETNQVFCDGWFRSGDVAVVEDGYYRILGRQSVDIIKTGGYKVSALEVEEILRTHPEVLECAVVGIEDAEWGERVCAAVLPRPGCRISLQALRPWAKERMAAYKIPSGLKLVKDLPRNSMGKVMKPEVKKLFEESA